MAQETLAALAPPASSESQQTPEAPQEEGGLNLLMLLHALRRRWLVILLAGVPLALICAGALWLLIPVRYEAVAELLVNSEEDRLLPAIDAGDRERRPSSDYDIFRQTQASLITSAFVLNSVLRRPEIDRLSMLDPEEVPNPIGFLQDEIEVTYPNDAEVMRIALKGDNPEEVKKLVDAVTDAYLEETVYNRRKALDDRMKRLQKEYAIHREEIRNQRESIHQREIQLGPQNASKTHIRHQLELEKLRSLEQTRMQLEERLHEIDLRLTLVAAAEDNRSVVDPPEYLVAEELEKDEQFMRLKAELDVAQQQYTTVAAAARSTSPSVQRAAAQTEFISQQLAARRRQLSRRVAQKLLDSAADRDGGETSVAMLNAEREILQQRYKQIKQEHEDQLAYVQQLDGYSARLETEREELAYDIKMNQARHAEIEDLKVQLSSPPRIKKIQSATIPNSNSRHTKLIQVISSGLVMFGLIAAGLIGWDLSQGPVNSAPQAADAIGAPVLGKLPALRTGWPLRKISKNDLEAIVAESLAGVRTALMRNWGRSGETSTVMITSAVGGEGKTMLASHLAVSFAQAGRRVLLVDADADNPQQHLVFGVDGSRGLCDCLRTSADIADYVERTAYEGLFLLPAGARDAASQRAMANDAFKTMLAEASGDYDFVLIDAGPVLTNAAPLILGRHADRVVLSVMRDVSHVAKLTEARDRLGAVGVSAGGIVVHNVEVATRRSQLDKRYGNPQPATASS